MRIALVGQPNSGKSTLFNQVAGYRSFPANFPGATVEYTIGKTYIENELAEIIDLPGTYSISWYDDAEKEAIKALFSMNIDVIVNIVDASTLIRSLELTWELISINKPMVIALNMMDEAKRKGIHINVDKLSEVLGIKVVPLVASKGKGVKELMIEAKRSQPPVKTNIYPQEIEAEIHKVEECIRKHVKNADMPARTVAIKALEGFKPCLNIISNTACNDTLKNARQKLKNGAEIERERHARCMNIFEQCAKVSRIEKKATEDILDSVLMHPIFGYLSVILIFLATFYIVFKGGSSFEGLIVSAFDNVDSYIESSIPFLLLSKIVGAVIGGIGAAIGIALPYLIPFLIIISILEDTGYLPRIAYLMDSIMHILGVHGTSVIPFVLGYGCSVPAVMATRTLKSKKEKVISAFLATLIPCSARTIVIMGLVGYFIGPIYAILLYGLNLVVVAVLGASLKKFLPGISPEIMFDIPPYRMPTVKTVLIKTWYRLKDFIYLAVPLLIAGSIILALISYYKLDPYINSVFAPVITGLLGLPASLGIVLIFGVMKKELTLIMLYQALSLPNFSMVKDVMSPEQMMVFTVFVIFYVPCLATISALWKEVGIRNTASITAGTLVLAIVLSFLARVAFQIL
ncbi:MAG: ferrous iron transport protein B [Deltaproteobacteria bacterium]|nr:ferrous iron transport protein B [Deltaproteobacteria bacterium]